MQGGRDIEDLATIIGEAQTQGQLKGKLGHKLPLWLNHATDIETPQSYGNLSEQGAEEQRDIAARLYQEFPKLISGANTNKPIVLKSTHVQRTKDSLNAFLDGLAQFVPDIKNHAFISVGEPGVCDPTLRFFDGCIAYKRYLQERPFNEAISKAVFSEKAKHTIHNILRRIFTDEFLDELDDNHDIKLVRIFYHLCQLDADLDQKNAKNGICSVFMSSDEIEPFNWEEDAFNFFAKGFTGTNDRIAHEIACPLVDDFMKTTARAIDDQKTAPIANFRFAHEETIIPFLVQLGFYRGDTIDTILHHETKRQFRTGVISPMAANVQWILYRCPHDQYLVRMRHNEIDKPFPIPGCQFSYGCDWRLVKDFYETQGRACTKETWENQICQGTNCGPIKPRHGGYSDDHEKYRIKF